VLREEVGEPAWLLGHSVGGAVMMLAAEQAPELVAGLISVEGNFTLKDAFWCSRIAAMPEADWAAEYGAMEDDPAAWLERSGIEASDQRIAWAQDILENQPYTTIQAMARSVLEVTGAPAYLEGVRRVLGSGVPLYLLGGELSAAGWDIPEWVLALACKSLVQPKAGHMMMLEDPAASAASSTDRARSFGARLRLTTMPVFLKKQATMSKRSKPEVNAHHAPGDPLGRHGRARDTSTTRSISATWKAAASPSWKT
jgi:pimeloyl-ACP methyl ester carboxylesterase